jgi:hypothetical protein
MHATLELSRNIVKVLQYHENKVRKEQAELLDAGNFIKDTHELRYPDKLFHFKRLISLNEYTIKPVLHVFLRFNLADSINNEAMRRVAQDYVEGMGFGDQPWLVYRHYDALHDHAHLVSTTIQHNGKRINLSPAQFHYSRKLTRELEQRYGLEKGLAQAEALAHQRYLAKVKYGETSLYPAMALVLETILPQYHYSSLEALNAVLRLYNLKAIRGKVESVTYQKRGLIYCPLKDNGQVAHAFIKASAFSSQPTLSNLEKRFAENIHVQEQHRRRLTSTVDYALAGKKLSFPAFQQAMAREKINLVVQQDGGGARTIWYVDHQTKTVFEGAALGAKYTEAGILQRCIPDEPYQQQVQAESQRQDHRIRHSL